MSATRGKLLPNSERGLSGLTDEESDEDEVPPRNKKYKKLKLSRNEIIAIVVGCVVVVCAVFLFVIIGVATAGSSNQAGVVSRDQQPWLSGRLPVSISPELYAIELQLDLASGAVNGSVWIDAAVTAPTPFVVLHAKDMSITSVEISQSGSIEVVDKYFYPSNEYFVVKLAAPVHAGSLNISMEFNYTLATDLAGFYRSSYLTSDGQRKALACTQFEATSARRAFPCFDEPDLKANFSVSIIHDATLSAASNMPVKSSEHLDDNRCKTVFDTSVKMSTYLVAFVVSDFKSESNMTTGNTKISVWSRPEALNETEYALAVAERVLEHYETFFNIGYPLPKQDLFAIPDFTAGAMENWGLITYRETALLYNPETAPAWAKQRVATVVAHELAHQWFGNLVTMKWWNDLWLNEGFASYVEYLGADFADGSLHMAQEHLEPELSNQCTYLNELVQTHSVFLLTFVGAIAVGLWYCYKVWPMTYSAALGKGVLRTYQDQFVIMAYQSALKLDSLSSSHPIEADVSSADEIDSQFDDISYDKGASILRMLNQYLGNDAFRKGLHAYLTRHIYDNAVMADLWAALDSVAKGVTVPVKDLMSTWTEQMGFPVIHVQRTDHAVSLQQKRFLSVHAENGSSTVASPFDYKWIIPLNYITNSSGNNMETLVLRQDSQTIPLNAPDDWIKFNINHTAFVRVNYDQEGWQKLIELFRSSIKADEVLTAVDRSGLIDDAFALASSGYPNICIDVPLQLVRHLGTELETSYVPWSTAVSWLRAIGTQLQYSPVFGKFKKQGIQIIQRRRRQLPWDTTGKSLSHNDIFLRSLLFDASWKFGDEEVLDGAYKLFQAFIVNKTRVDPNLKDVVYGAGVAKGSVLEWDQLWKIYNTTTDSQEQSIILRALAQSKEHWILNRYLGYAMTEVRSQDSLYVIHYIAQNEHGLRLAWDMFVQHWPHLLERYGIGSFAMRRILHTFGQSFNTPAQLEEFQEFFADDTIRQSRGVQQAIEMLRGNVWWQSHVYPDIENWLRNHPL